MTSRPAIWKARELHIRPKRKFLRRSSAKTFFIAGSNSFITYYTGWFIGIITKPGAFVNTLWKINSYQTTSLVLDFCQTFPIITKTRYRFKCDEGKSTPYGRLTESLRVLKEDRQSAGEHGSGAAWLSGYQVMTGLPVTAEGIAKYPK